ncbi:MAG: hypothetical protein IJ320_07700 [Phascolarctobacterium sp.]|nr:hypothetical protein [Phascolarctobacterium sp.]
MKLPNIKSSRFSVAPKGEDILIVDSVSYIEEKNAVKVTYRMRNANRKHTEYYKLDVEFQVNALGNMLRAAYNDESIDDINEDILNGSVGRQVRGDIVHREWMGKTYAGIDAFSYAPVDELFSFAKSINDIIHDEETASIINNSENIA